MNKYLSFVVLITILISLFLLLLKFTSMGEYKGDIFYLLKEHIVLVLTSGGLAIVLGIFFGILLSRSTLKNQAENIMQFFNICVSIPTLAILALSMSFLGIGLFPSVVGLFIATLLPIIKNTYVGIKTISPSILEAANAMGMSPFQILFKVEIPNALYVIFSGIKTAIAINIGTAPLVFLIGGGGLGDLIFSGIDLDIMPMLLAGAITIALSAIIADKIIHVLSNIIISKGVLPNE